jgi:hypothetical protein
MAGHGRLLRGQRRRRPTGVNDDAYDLVIDVAAGQPTIRTIAERLRQLVP